TAASSAAAMARSRKRSSPSTPRAGDTPESGAPLPPPNPALAHSLSLATMSVVSFDYERNGDFEATLNLSVSKFNYDSNWQKLGEIGGFMWNVRGVKKNDESLTVRRLKHVLLSVDHADHDRWSYDVDLSAVVVSKNAKAINLILLPNKEKDEFPKEHCWMETCPWSEIIHKECFDAQDSSITVSFKIQIVASSGVNPRRLIEFNPEVDHLNDVKLVVEGKAIAVSKNYLAIHSPFFNSLFYRDFAEKNKEEIEIPGVKYEDVIQMLKIIYPSHCKVNASNVEGVVFLSDLWDISIARRKCDKFLANDVVKPDATVVPKVPLAKKVLYASRYSLPKLQHTLLTAFNKKRIIEVMDSIEYKEV
ncbi:hypothetical protein PMAYCL1PPCAC_24357, partial [Pristionchus mayeri]